MTNHAGPDPAVYYLDDLGATVGVAGPSPLDTALTLSVHAGPAVVEVTLSASGASAVAGLLVSAVTAASGENHDLGPDGEQPDGGGSGTSW